MDGITVNKVTLFLGKLPERKQECFYFVEGESLIPVAYIRPEMLEIAQRLWLEILKGIIK